MPRYTSFYNKSLETTESTITLDKAESHHLVSVLRAKKSSTVNVFTPHNQSANCELTDSSSSAASLKVLEHLMPTLPSPIHLAQALPKAKGMESIIRKAVEIGTSQIIPLITQNTNVRLDDKRVQCKLSRWQSIVIEACKQSHNFNMPQVTKIHRFTELLKQHHDFDGLKLIASLQHQSQTLNHYFSIPPSKVLCLIGPEGDFSDTEYQQAQEAGFLPLSLAKNILRVETATTYILSVLDYEFRKATS